MKITRNTPHQLIAAHVPWVTGCVLIAAFVLFSIAFLSDYWKGEKTADEMLLPGIFVLGVFGSAFSSLVQRIQIIFDRTDDTITVRRRTIAGYKSETFRLSDLARAEVQADYSGNKGPKYRPVLHFGKDSVPRVYPIRSAYTSWSIGMGEAMEAINKWLTANQTDSDTQSI